VAAFSIGYTRKIYVQHGIFYLLKCAKRIRHKLNKIEQKQRMKKGMRERGVSDDDVCDCCFGEQLDNKKIT
jgi:hypothetical protein